MAFRFALCEPFLWNPTSAIDTIYGVSFGNSINLSQIEASRKSFFHNFVKISP